MFRKRIILIFAVLIIAALDQATKSLIVTNIPLNDSIEITSFFNIVYIQNVGAAFGSLKGLGNPIFIVLSIIVIIFLTILIFKEKQGMLLSLSYCLLIGGAVGNLIDRLTRGYVVDFLDFHVSDYHWASFNVADSALSVGMVLVILIQLKGLKQK
ncbi:MAG: signal peptidase II [Nitrospirae bacterium]|nr:signal peptidase II [Nitrospirota bacterium]